MWRLLGKSAHLWPEWFYKLISKIHSKIIRFNHTFLGEKIIGDHILLLETIGSKTKQLRKTPLTYANCENDYIVAASYSGGTTAQNSTTAYGVTYTGVEGLTAYYGAGEVGSTSDSGDITSMGVSYAMGSFTAAYSVNEADMTTAADEEQTSYKVSYTVTDDLSVTYGEETHDTNGQAVDEEFESISVSYTTGGMTLSATQYNFEGSGNTAGAAGEKERWALSATFAF